MKTLILGSGQGGGKIAVAYPKQSGDHVIALNSTVSDAIPNLESGYELYFLDKSDPTGGAGQNAARGQELLADNYDIIEEKLVNLVQQQGQPQVVFITASLGGGTGSGTIGHLAEMVKRKVCPKVPLIGLVTLPESSFLNPNSASNVLVAYDTINATGGFDSVIFWDNDKFFAKGVPLPKVNLFAWGPIQRAFKYIGRQSSVSTLDVNDFKLLMQGGGGAAAVFETNLPTSVGDINKVMDAIHNSWTLGYYPEEISHIPNEFAGFGLMMVVPSPQKESLFNTLIKNFSNTMMQQVIKVNGFFVDPSLPSQQYKIFTIFTGLPFPDHRLKAIKDIALIAKSQVNHPDLLDDQTIASVQANLKPNTTIKRESKLFELTSDDQGGQVTADAPLLRRRSRNITN